MRAGSKRLRVRSGLAPEIRRTRKIPLIFTAMDTLPAPHRKAPVNGSWENPVLAVFGFDHTLTDRHSFWRFLHFVAGPWRFYLTLLSLVPALSGYLRGKLTLLQVWEAAARDFLAGLPEERFRELARRFAREKVPQWISPAALRRLRWHQSQGHVTALVSNAPEAYLGPWARQVGFDEVIGTRFQVKGGRITGRLVGDACYGVEKVRRLQAARGPLNQYCLYIYGDSAGDQELLALARFPYYRVFRKDKSAIEPFGRY
jgi:phosphatidylglycerophosphatase C